VQAYLIAMAAGALYSMREGLRKAGVTNHSALLFEDLMDSKTLLFTGNTVSVYVIGWLNLKDGPIVMEVGPCLLGFVNDFWSQHVTDMGKAGPAVGKGGKFLFLPPAYKGEIPWGTLCQKQKL
jgi:hypothetical protein